MVRRYLTLLDEWSTAMMAEMEPMAGGGSLTDLIRAANRCEAPRKWQVAGEVAYAVHGVGCRLSMRGVGAVDADIGDGDRLVFDAWRVWVFATGLGRRRIPDRADVAIALGEATVSGLVDEMGSGWYAAAAFTEVDRRSF